MAKKWQHYVPRVYTKAWETTVYSKKEPNKPFEGVYYYERSDLSKGDGRNNGSILAKNHTYTIDFNYTFILSRCPKIRIEFAEEIKKILRDRKVKAYFNGTPLSNRNAISTNLSELDNWEFFNLDNTPASKKSNINAIKEIRSYCLEDKFGSYVEDRWEAILKKFLAPFPKSNGTGQIEFSHSDTQAITKMIEMLAVMMCRNPSFDLLGAFSWMKDEILVPIYSQYGYVAEAEVIIRGVWLTEIYKGLYGKTGFVDSFISSAFSKLGIVVFRVANDIEGSFITSDNPVVYYNYRIESHNSNGIYFPLTPQYMLFLGKRSEGNVNDVVFSTVHNEDIRRINRIILNSAETGIVSTKQYLGHIL
mgnify:CR=1 FL=1